MLALYHNLSPVAIFSSLCYKNCLRSLSYFLSQTFNRRPGSKQQQGEEGQEEKELQIGNFKRRFPNILPMSIRIDQYSIVKLLLTCYLLLSKWVGSNILLFLRIKCNQISFINNLHICVKDLLLVWTLLAFLWSLARVDQEISWGLRFPKNWKLSGA